MKLKKLHKTNVVRHERSRTHRLSVTKAGEEKDDMRRGMGPSMEQFRLAWAELRKDRPPRQGITHVGKAKQITRMRACLAEAFRCHHRDFVRELRSPG